MVYEVQGKSRFRVLGNGARVRVRGTNAAAEKTEKRGVERGAKTSQSGIGARTDQRRA